MKKVSRGTGPAVRPILFRADMRAAMAAGDKTETRRVIDARNSTVQPGTFAGVDFSTGRARRLSTPEVRARCSFDSGRVRVVTVAPIVRAGDLFWTKANRFSSKAKSESVLEVLTVDVARVQDMTEAQALAEGIAHYNWKKRGPVPASHRLKFAALWDEINGAGAWDRNDWVWIYRFRRFGENIEAMLARWESTT